VDKTAVFLAALLAGVLLGVPLAGAGDIPPSPRTGSGVASWPTLHNDNQRSGYTDEVIKGPYERKWYRDFHDEMIATRVEGIVAEGKCFVGTFAGNLYALNVKDGKTAWTFRAAGPIGASPCYEDGRLYVGADEGFNKGRLYCLNAADGKELWRYDAGAGIWTSPACDGKKVYFGDRAGVFHAVDAKTGKLAWTLRTGYMILTPASISRDGRRIVFASEDMHVYCVSPEGKELWKSPKCAGLSLRDHGPTLWRGLAVVRTNPADGFHTVLGRNGELLENIQRSIPVGEGDKILMEKWGDLMMHPTPARRKAEQDGVIEYLREHPYDRTFYAFDLKDGTEPWISPVLYTCGLHNPATAPTYNPATGRLFAFYRTALSYYLRGVRRYNGLAEIDRETGRVVWSFPEQKHDRNRSWYGMPMIGDETQSLSMMGDWLISNHQGDIGAIDLKTENTVRIWPGRDSYGGIFGPGTLPGKFEGAREMSSKGYLTGMPNEWHGPDRSICAIAMKRLFWVVGSHVVCLGGPDVPRTASGGTKPPAPFKRRLPDVIAVGNVARSGIAGFDEDAEKIDISAEQLGRYVGRPPTVAQDDSALAQALRQRLDEAVLELVAEKTWAPLVVELGISREEVHFRRTAETIQTVSPALPHLSAEVKAKALAFLDVMVDGGCPLKVPLHHGAGAKRREPYDLGPGMAEADRRSSRYVASIEDVYALWAYAAYGDRWEKLRPLAGQIKGLIAPLLTKPFTFDHDRWENDPSEHLNAQIAGVLAWVRIMRRLETGADTEQAMKLLASMVTERVHHERADRRLIRRTKNGAHSAKVPRYVALTPEVSRMLSDLAGEALERNVRDLATGLPVWYQAWGERMIGGENYISPPHLARGLFAALADGVGAEPDELARYLDQPWCKADLYYIEKLSAILRRIDAAEK